MPADFRPGWEDRQRAYERSQVFSALVSLAGVVAIAAGFVIPLLTRDMWWMLSIAGGVFLLLAANPGTGDKMEVYKLSGDHWFEAMESARLVALRARCRCGYRTRAYLRADAAANALIIHQALAGERVDTGSVAPGAGGAGR